MTHQSEEIIIGGLLRPWKPEYADRYPGVSEHFSGPQITRILGLEHKEEITLADKLFLLRMYAKLILTAV